MKKLLLLVPYLFFHIAIFGQGFDNNWVIGFYPYLSNHPFAFLSGNNIIRFEDNQPNVTNLSSIYACSQNCHTISDSSGVLRFMFNGDVLLDNDGEVIANGGNLNTWATVSNPERASGYKNMIVLPNENHKYHIFSQNIRIDNTLQLFVADTLFLTTVNMSLNNGKGRVIVKNKVIATGSYATPIQATKHANGRDWILYSADRFENTMYRYIVSADTIIGPLTQEGVGFLGIEILKGQVELSMAPNGKHMVIYNENYGFSIFDIDRCSGLIIGERQILDDSYMHAAGCFGSDNIYYFVSMRDSDFPSLKRVLMQLDISQPNLNLDLIDNPTEIQDTPNNTYTYYGPLALTPHGKIFQYGIQINGYDSLSAAFGYHVIDFPRRKGTACNYRQFHDGFLMDKAVGLGAPQYPNYRLGPIDGSPCDTLGLDNHPLAHFRWDIEDSLAALQLTFTDLSAYEPATWSWDFGDPASGAENMSSDTSPVHVFSGPGVYQVCQTVCNVNSCDTVCKEVVLGMTNASNDELRIQDGSFVVYPNPVEDVLYVRPSHGVTLSHPVTMMRLYDVAGRLIFQEKMSKNTSEWRFSVENVRKGLYFYEIKNSAGAVVQMGKVVRQ